MTPVVEGDPTGGWKELVETNAKVAADAHERLRFDLERTVVTLATLTSTVDRNYRYFEDQNAALRMRLAEVSQIAQRPIDGSSVVWSTKALATIFTAATVIAGAFLWTQNTMEGLKAQVTVLTRSVEDLKQARIDDKREAQDRLNQLLQQSLKETIISAGPAAPRKGAR